MHEDIIVSGSGGQGVLVMGQIMTHAAMIEGNHVVWFPTYGPEARGGTASCTVIISSEEIGSPITAYPDTLIGMDVPLFHNFMPSVKPGGTLVINSCLIAPDSVRNDCKVVAIPANKIAEELGSVQSANMVVLGAFIGLSGILRIESVMAALPEIFPAHRHKFIPINEMAIRKGMELVGMK